MMRSQVAALAVLVAAAVLGCQTAPAAPPSTEPPPPGHVLGDVFVLGLGQETTIVGEGVRVRFDAVLTDARCPTNVVCVWQGMAAIGVTVFQQQGAPQSLQLSILGRIEEVSDGVPARVPPYTVQLRWLDPYPDSAKVTDKASYRASLVVGKSG